MAGENVNSGSAVPPGVSTTSSDGEAELVERAKADPEAFGQLYERHYSRILNYLYRRTLDISLAEALTSDTFFKALRGLWRYERRGPFKAWLYRIATNELRMHWRSAKTRRTRHLDGPQQWQRVTFTDSAGERPEDVEERMRQFAEVRQGLCRLPERYQTVLALRYFEAPSYAEISQTLGKRLGTVKSLIHRGLKRLAREIRTNRATFPGEGHRQSAGTEGEGR